VLRLREIEPDPADGATQKGAARNPGWRLETVDLRQMEGPAAVDDTPRSLRRCDPDQVPRDCLNPGQRDTPGGYITKLPNVFRAHQCPVTGQMHRNRACRCFLKLQARMRSATGAAVLQ
jgi:hypothetical protein